MTDIASGAMNSVLPFMLKNLVSSFLASKTLAIRSSDVVYVKLDASALRIMVATHEFLIAERFRAEYRNRQRVLVGLAVVVALSS